MLFRSFGFYFGFPAGFVLVGVLHLLPFWWVLPIGGVVIGWVANYLAIEIVFAPVYPKRWVPWKQGLIIRRQEEVTETYATMIADDVITVENIGYELLHGARSDRTQQMLEAAVRPAVDKAVGPMRAPLKAALGTKDYRKIQDSFAVEATSFAPAAFGDEEFNKEQSTKIYAFVAAQMGKMGPEDYTDLLRLVEVATRRIGCRIVLEGYGPPPDSRITQLSVTPDPGVIEVNVQPTASWAAQRDQIGRAHV